MAEPSGVREKFQDAEMEGAIELMETKLHTMVTVISPNPPEPPTPVVSAVAHVSLGGADGLCRSDW